MGGVSGECDLCVPDKGDRVSSLLPTPQIPTSTRTSSTGSVALSFVRSRQARGETTETSQLSTHCVPPGFPSPLVPETALRLSGPIWQCLESFGVITMEGATGIYLGGRSRGCRYTSYNAQDSPQTKTCPTQDLNSAVDHTTRERDLICRRNSRRAVNAPSVSE